MGSSLSQLDWVALGELLIVYPLMLFIAGAWTASKARAMYKKWREELGWIIALRGWAWMPLLLLAGALAASSLFLYWRNSFPVDDRIQRDLIMGFTIANVFCFHAWSPALLWGVDYWFLAAGIAFCMASTATVVLAIMGWAGAWLPFGLYFFYPVFAWFITLVTVVFWWHAGSIGKSVRGWGQAMRRGANMPGKYVDRLMDTIDTRMPQQRQRRVPVAQPPRTYAQDW